MAPGNRSICRHFAHMLATSMVAWNAEERCSALLIQTTELLALQPFPLPLEPSDGLEPSTPSLPLSNEAGHEGKSGKPRARKPRKEAESADKE